MTNEKDKQGENGTYLGPVLKEVKEMESRRHYILRRILGRRLLSFIEKIFCKFK